MAGSLALGGSQAQGQRVTGLESAANETWLNGLVGPVTGPGGASALASVGPDTAVVPVGGDPGRLVLATPDAGAASPTPDPAASASRAGAPGGVVTAPVVPGSTLPSQLDVAAPPAPGETGVTSLLTTDGIPVRILKAYIAAADVTARTDPSCHLSWSLLAGIGRIESDHGRFAGARVADTGVVSPAIYGPRLVGGSGMASVRDSDGGQLDADPSADRAMGPMQFIPGTWRSFGTDGDGDGVANPQDIDDAALSAARYLCYGSADLSVQADRWRAVLRYNYSASYVAHVLALADSYATGKVVPLTTPPPGVTSAPAAPAATPAASPTAPSASPSPSKSPSASPSPSPSKSPSASPSPSSSASASPSGSASSSASSSASASASSSASPSATSSTSPTTSASPTTAPSASDPAPTTAAPEPPVVTVTVTVIATPSDPTTATTSQAADTTSATTTDGSTTPAAG